MSRLNGRLLILRLMGRLREEQGAQSANITDRRRQAGWITTLLVRR